jgi:two-component system, NarL family, sensor kinase
VKGTYNLILIYVIFLFGLSNIHGQDFTDQLSRVRKLTDSLQYDQAIGLLHELLREAKEINNDSIIIDIQIKLASAHLGVEKNEIGIDYYLQAKALAQETNNQRQVANTNYGLGAALQQMEKYDSSKIYYKQAISYFLEVDDSVTLSYLYSNLSLLYYKSNQPDSMLYYSTSALEIQLKTKDRYGSGASYSNLGLVAKDKGEYKEAIKYYKKSSIEYQKVNFIRGYSISLRELALSHYFLNSFDSAAYYFYAYDSIGHHLFHQDYEDKILELETKFKTAEIERDNALKQAEIENNQQRLTLLYFTLAALLLISLSVYVYINQRRKRLKVEALRNQEIANQKIQDLLQTQEIKTTYALLEGQDKERKRIAIELHDNLGSILTSLNMFSDALQARIDPKEIKNIANRISETSVLANEEIRKISHSLDSGLLKHFGLKAAIKQLIEAVESAKKITFNLELQIGDDISNEKGLEVYRIIQELVNNALKHAQCSKIHLEINQINNHLSIIYEDNGVGFNQNTITHGMGLKNILNRAERLDGEFNMESTPGKGSTFIIELPNI